VLALQEEDQVAHRLVVLLLGDLADAGPGAALDVVEEAGAPVHLLHVQGAGAELEEALELLDRLAQGLGVGVGAEVAGPVRGHPARGVHPGEARPGTDLEVEVLLVVPELDVVAGAVLLEEVALQEEGLLLRVGDDVLEVGDAGDHRPHLGAQVFLAAEVGADPVA
jgi:hypothetical protein